MRSARLADAPALAALWSTAGLHFRAEFVEPELQLALARNPDLVIVANEPSGGLGGLGVRHVRRAPRLAEPPGHEPGPARPGHRDGAGPRAGTAPPGQGLREDQPAHRAGQRGRGPLLHAARFPVPQPDLHGQVDRRCVPRPLRAAQRGPGYGHTRHRGGPGLAGGPGRYSRTRQTAGRGGHEADVDRSETGALPGALRLRDGPRAAPGHRAVRGRPRGRRPHSRPDPGPS